MERKIKWSYKFYAHHSPSIGRLNNFGATCIPPKIYSKRSNLRWLERAEDLLNNQNRFVGLSFVSVKFYSGVHE